VDDKSLYCTTDKNGEWERKGTFEAGEEKVDALAVCAGMPLVVCKSKILSPTDGRSFSVPRLAGESPVSSLRTMATFATDSVLWIGTGRGEWGGHLVGFNPRTEKWVSYYDELHYVTGITWAADGHILVSWSMSHFGADTLIRSHRDDAQVAAEYPKLKSAYYQRVTFGPGDQKLYAIEGRSLVMVVDGRPKPLAESASPVFGSERMAIGVSPGVIAVLPVAENVVLVIPNRGAPWKYSAAGVTTLQRP
jgi:hypothetical protein